MFFQKNTNNNLRAFLFFVVFFSAGFILTSSIVHAQTFVGDVIVAGFKIMLYGIFTAIGWLASVAITIFEWGIKPEYISGPTGFFNAASVYAMWKFVRDFFNLFFILTLLYIAFTIVFQVAGDYKKTLLSLVLAALFINFSFPITRFMIDASNVPMYFFANQMGYNGTVNNGQVLGSIMSASEIQGILLPQKADSTVAQLIMSIIFLFIFSISLVVLAIMFVIRMAALLILLIFSSVGFAATVIPGLSRFSNMWWENLTKYLLFGPAAMLMLYIATRIFAGMADGVMREQFRVAAQNTTVGEMTSFLAAMAMFSVPMIILWMAIGLASTMSIAGGGAVTGAGYKFANWTKKKTLGGAKWIGLRNPVSNTARGIGLGVKDRVTDSRLAKYLKSPSWFETGAKGMATGKGWSGGARSGYAKYQAQEVNKKVKENKDNQVNRSSLLKDLESGDKVERQAAALTLAENGEIRSANDLTQALKAVAGKLDKSGNPIYDDTSTDMALKIIDKAKDGATVGISENDYASIANNDAFYVKEKDGKTREQRDGKDIPVAALETLNSKLKKDGQIKLRVDYEIAKKGDTPETRKAVYDDLIGKMSGEDLAKQDIVFKDENFREYAKTMETKRLQKVMDKASEKSNAKIQGTWAKIIEGKKEKGKTKEGSPDMAWPEIDKS